MTAPFLIRDGRETDHPFVFASWIRSYRESAWGRSMRQGTFDVGHHALIVSLLARPSAQLLVAVAPEADGVILGWALVELPTASAPGVLHYVFVKGHLRGNGFARALVDPAGESFAFTHKTIAFEKWQRRAPVRDALWSYNPFLAFVPRSA